MVDPDIREIFSAPLDGFTKKRDEVASRVKKSGQAERAKQIKKLRKPTVVAWALNQISSRNSKQLEWLFQADEKFRALQSARPTARQLREASRSRQEIVSDLVEAGAKALREGGYPDTRTNRQKIAQTLLAASTDDAVKNGLREGRLEREARPSGFGFPLELHDTAAVVVSSRAREKASRLAEEASEAEREASELERAARDADRDAAEAEREARVARDAADRAAKAALRAGERALRKRTEADEAENRIDEG